jgi:two-component system nitrate/nitrite response regulator NarL
MEAHGVIRIVLADDHPIFRDGLKSLLATEPKFSVVGEAADGIEAVQVTSALAPDVLLLDVAMPRVSGITVLERLAILMPSVRVLLLTASVGRDDVLKAMRAGARGVLLKEHATPQLFASIRAVMQGQYWVDAEHVGKVIDAIRDPSQLGNVTRKASNRYSLTARELQVINGVTKGESNREIAGQLEIREDTVKHHLSSIFDKVGVFSRVELAVFAIHHGLIVDEPILVKPLDVKSGT